MSIEEAETHQRSLEEALPFQDWKDSRVEWDKDSSPVEDLLVPAWYLWKPMSVYSATSVIPHYRVFPVFRTDIQLARFQFISRCLICSTTRREFTFFTCSTTRSELTSELT